MKHLLRCALLGLLAGCQQAPQKDIVPIPASAFEATVEGRPVGLYTLRAGDLCMQVTNYGARIVTLWAPDREGGMEDIVLGYESLDRYVDNTGERFLGAVVGPVANRIADGTFTLDGTRYTLPQNDHGQTLHGGEKGLDRVVWDVVEHSGDRLVFHYLHRDGEEGFPGNLDITMTYALTDDNALRIDYEATTDRATPVNLSHHSFFNLAGEGNGPILDHELMIRAGRIVPVDGRLIPTGEIAGVEGTPFDFRTPTAIGARIDADDEQLHNGGGYDLCWVLDRRSDSDVEHVATVYEPTSGRVLEVWSDQPGLQFYSGNFFDGATAGKYGRPLRYRESFALEAQKFPDAPNHASFPSTTLRPGERYTQTCIYRFTTR